VCIAVEDKHFFLFGAPKHAPKSEKTISEAGKWEFIRLEKHCGQLQATQVMW
jgi:hypothetical protein